MLCIFHGVFSRSVFPVAYHLKITSINYFACTEQSKDNHRSHSRKTRQAKSTPSLLGSPTLSQTLHNLKKAPKSGTDMHTRKRTARDAPKRQIVATIAKSFKESFASIITYMLLVYRIAEKSVTSQYSLNVVILIPY